MHSRQRRLSTWLSTKANSSGSHSLAAHSRSAGSKYGSDDNGKQMLPVLPGDRLIEPEPQVKVAHEGGRLQGMAGSLVEQLMAGQAVELVIDERNQF